MADENKEPGAPGSEVTPPETSVYSSHSDPYSGPAAEPYVGPPAPYVVPPADTVAAPTPVVATPQVLARRTPPPPPPPPPPEDEEEGDEEEKGMLRMSFMGHLEELRSRLIQALAGVVISFFLSMFFSKELWRIVQAPAQDALTKLGVNPPSLVAITPMEGFNIIWIKMPLLVSIFLASPWLLYQVWAFISPGLYKREKRWAVPFILCTAGLFITGGLFAYLVAFRFGLQFLLGVGLDVNVRPMVTISEYFDLFVNVTLGVALVFEMPVVIFFLTLLRLASPRFLLRHSRYAVLAITVLAAVVTPTPDVFNMMIFAVPMVLLFFVGVFASHLLVLKRENRKFPWLTVLLVLLGVLLVMAGVVALLIYRYHYHFVPNSPYFVHDVVRKAH